MEGFTEPCGPVRRCILVGKWWVSHETVDHRRIDGGKLHACDDGAYRRPTGGLWQRCPDGIRVARQFDRPDRSGRPTLGGGRSPGLASPRRPARDRPDRQGPALGPLGFRRLRRRRHPGVHRELATDGEVAALDLKGAVLLELQL